MATKHPTEAGVAAVMPPQQQAPPMHVQPILTTNMAASSLTTGGNSCLDEQIERLKRCEYLREGEVKALCLRAREILVDESNVQRVDAPVTVSVCVCVKAKCILLFISTYVCNCDGLAELVLACIQFD